jgi:hypothetical protein
VAVKISLAADEGSVEEDEPLAPRTTWKIGGPARWFNASDGGEIFDILTEARLVSPGGDVGSGLLSLP